MQGTVVGKHINKIHPVSKITNALKTGQGDMNCFYFSSDVTNIARIESLYKGEKLVGAIDYDLFTNGRDLKEFLNKLEEFSSKGLLNYQSTFHVYVRCKQKIKYD